ncbi:MAG: hypothetical protein U0704_08225 [Candidatus Eisenbacteria bacterium]
MHAPDPQASRTRPHALALVAAAALVQCAGATIGAFRADDWTNLERGRWALTPEGLRGIWTGLNPFTLYRPLVDLWHGAMMALFGLNAPPMLLVMTLLALAQTALLARLARERGGDRTAAALAAAAWWAQVNAYAWTTQWVSNVTGSLLALFSLLALVQHHRAVRAAGRGRSAVPAVLAMLAAFAAGALCKEEIVLLPAGLAALEWARRDRLSPRERTAALRSWLALAVLAAAYLVFRTQVLPTPQVGSQRYHLTFGANVLVSAAYFAAHLGALPATAWALTRVLWPASHARDTWDSPAGRAARREALAAFAWAASATLLYLPISGKPAYGYYYLPAFAVALGTARLLAHAAAAARPARLGAAGALATHFALLLALVATGLWAGAWHTYRARTLAVWATLDREYPEPPPGAKFVFLDASGAECFVGRSIFNLIFDGATGAMLRLHYGRSDLQGTTLYGPEAASLAALPADVTAVYHTRLGRIERVVNPAPPRADDPMEAGGTR